MINIWHRFVINATPETVYQALTTQAGLAGWWTPTAEAKPETGSIARFPFGPDYHKEMEVTKLKPFEQVQWRCLTGYDDWMGTTLTFDMAPHQNGTLLFFHHDGWKEYTPGFASCNYDWAMFLRSLKLLCETGKGLPYPYQYQ